MGQAITATCRVLRSHCATWCYSAELITRFGQEMWPDLQFPYDSRCLWASWRRQEWKPVPHPLTSSNWKWDREGWGHLNTLITKENNAHFYVNICNHVSVTYTSCNSAKYHNAVQPNDTKMSSEVDGIVQDSCRAEQVLQEDCTILTEPSCHSYSWLGWIWKLW